MMLAVMSPRLVTTGEPGSVRNSLGYFANVTPAP
jgi:hypothetical protein